MMKRQIKARPGQGGMSAERDEWEHISDRKARKRVQNRLAQRAHRTKYGRATQRQLLEGLETPDRQDLRGSTLAAAQGSTRASFQQAVGEEEGEGVGEEADVPAVASSSNPGHLVSARPRRVVDGGVVASPLLDVRHITIPGMQTLSALLTNGDILQVDCRSRPRKPAIYVSPLTRAPPALVPLALQYSKPHMPFVDILPFPSLRGTLLRAGEIVRSAEFWADLTSGSVRVWGMTPWDKRGWEVHESFATKWWWLMTDEVLEETNFWRVSRGERPLFLASLAPRANAT